MRNRPRTGRSDLYFEDQRNPSCSGCSNDLIIIMAVSLRVC
jgi:hypothetical protein